FLVWRRRKGVTSVLIAIFIGTFLGFILEFQQIYIIGRTFNPVDAYLNIAGAIVGLVVAVIVLIRQDKMDLVK
ncbi:VanZ family protein, partial [Candidatus Bipolaricaulota bacterium]|nr:VanZ family protein [Candidatus Bipolaricaulota bacterium]